MPTLPTLAVFSIATLALLLVPGPAVVYIVTRSVAQGRTAGIISVAGIHVGSLVHVVAAALGLSALLAASATAFTVVKYAGAAYLVYLGVRKLMTPGDGLAKEVEAVSRQRLFGEGFVVNVLNPKTAIFFLAFLPQFVDPSLGPVAAQVAVLGLVWTVLGMASDGTYAVLSAALAARLRRSPVAARRVDVASGLVYIGLGTAAALAGDGPRK
ncbi:LysE family translocator [Sphaerisporangium sp. TRM90804]|uniref:LysE family translocator n=1 Tax=Sphaerisporangium sp. TRM90804 TaxID=3031113 RepID=UPI0024499502|nr:LysE family translocator [Sphaerisporangium sp. TRM90804]MDH2427932.1 LysE family translocator [Sphaerisporangium sp. TRM90804]